MADEELLRSIRIVEPDANKKIDNESTTSSTNYKTRIRNSDWTARLDVCQKGRRKYAVLRSPNTYFPDIDDDYKFEKVDRSMSDDEIIKNALSLLKRQAADNGYRNFEIFSSGDDLSKNQMVLQDPWKDSTPTLRHYGFTHYYLNDGSQVHIEWKNDVYSVGSKFDNADGFVEKRITYFPYSKDFGTDILSPEFKDQSDVSTRNIVKYQKKDSTFDWADKVEYKDREVYTGNQEDSNIIEYIISGLKSQIIRFNGVDSKLALCNPDTESCKLIRHVDFNAVTPPTTTDGSATKDLTPVLSQSSDKTKLFLVGLPDDIQIKVGENLPDFSVHVNKIYTPPEKNINNIEIDEEVELDPEYQESPISIAEEQALILESQETFNAVDGALADSVAASLEGSTPISQGNWKLDLIPGEFVTNGGTKIKCCQIDGAVINIKIAPSYLDMRAAAAADGISIKISSGFRSPYDSISGKSESGVSIHASSQKYLYDGYIAGKPGFNLAAKPGGSNHGNGIGLDLNTGGKSSGRFINVDRKIYTWLVKNSWRYGFIRAVPGEEWHYDYLPDLAKKGPYGKLPATDLGKVSTKFYKDWGLDNLSIT